MKEKANTIIHKILDDLGIEYTDCDLKVTFNLVFKEWRNDYDESTKSIKFQEHKVNEKIKIKVDDHLLNDEEFPCTLNIDGNDRGIGMPLRKEEINYDSLKRVIMSFLKDNVIEYAPKKEYEQLSLF